MTLLFAVSLAVLGTGCSGSDPAPGPGADAPAEPERIEIRLALNWYPEPEFGGFYEGVLGGHYAAAGFDVTVLPGGPGAPTLELLTSGQAEAAISAADDLLVKRNKGARAIGVWPAFQLAPNGLMVHASAGVTAYDQITDRDVAIEIGSPFQQFLWSKYGWEGSVRPVPYGGSVGPFVADTKTIQQAYITSEPCAARAKGADPVFLKASDAGWNPYGVLLALPEPMPAWAGDFVNATATAWAAYNEDPARANAEIAKLNDQMTPEMLGCVTEAQVEFVTGTDGMGAMTAERWEATAASLVELGLLPEGATAEGAWKSL